MSGVLINVKCTCRKCFKALTIEEIHYFGCSDGTATCEVCEEEWLEKMHEWRGGVNGDPMPERP